MTVGREETKEQAMSNADKMQRLLDCKRQFFETRSSAIDLLAKLNALHHEFDMCLDDLIDNGLDIEYLHDVCIEYETMRFNSSTVAQFMSKVEELVLSDVDAEAKKSIEATQIDFKKCTVDFASSDGRLAQIGPVSITFIDNNSTRQFTVSIPIKGCMQDTNPLHWSNARTKQYHVTADMTIMLGLTTVVQPLCICSSFNASDVSRAVKNLLYGKYDDELNSQLKNPSPLVVKYSSNANMQNAPFSVDSLSAMNIHSLFDAYVEDNSTNLPMPTIPSCILSP